MEKFKDLTTHKKIDIIVNGLIYLLIIVDGIVYLAGAIERLALALIGIPLLIILNVYNGISGWKEDSHKSKLDFIFAAILVAFLIIYLGNVIY